VPVDPPPPPVTIVDPNDPAGTPDLLHNGREPWRPTKRQVLATTAVVTALALTAGLAALLQHHRHEQELDRAAARAVRLLVQVRPVQISDGGTHTLQVAVYNDGPALVHVLAVRLDDGSALPVTIGTDLQPRTETTLSLPDGTSCATDAGRTRHIVSVDLTTERGHRLTRTQPLQGDMLNGYERTRCGTLLPAEAFVGTVTALRQHGGWWQITLDLRNTSVLPLSLRTLKAPPGVELELHRLPLALSPAAQPGTTGPSKLVTVRLRLADCNRFNKWLLDSEQYDSTLTAGLRGRYEAGSGRIALTNPIPNEGRPFGLDVQTTLMGTCPELFFN
jgi:hypothetical protein